MGGNIIHSVSLCTFYNLTAHIFPSFYMQFCSGRMLSEGQIIVSLPQNLEPHSERKMKAAEQDSKIIRKTKMSPTFLAVKELRPSLKQSENARCLVHLGLLTTRHIVKSHPQSVSSSLPASALAWPRAQRLCYVHPDVILDSWVQQVNLGDNKWKKTGFSWILPAVDFVQLPEAYEWRDSLSPFVVFIYTPDLHVIHQIMECIKRNYLTGRQGYLYQLLHSSASAHSLSCRRQ